MENQAAVEVDDFENIIDNLSSSNHDQWVSIYNAINTSPSSLHHLGLKSWNTTASMVMQFHFYQMQPTLQQYNNQWNSVYQSRNLDQVKTFLKTYYQFVTNKMNEIKAIPSVAKEINSPFSPAIDSILQNVSSSFNSLTTTTKDQINNGIENVIALKSSLNLTGSFKDEIISGHKSSKNTYRILFFAQLGLILLATLLAIYFALVANYSDADFWRIFAMKASVGIPILLVWTFLNSEFRVVRVEFLKMKHLLSLINGGATAVPQMVNESASAKHDALSKIADSFVDLNQTMALVDKNMQKSADVDLKMILELADKIASRAKQ